MSNTEALLQSAIETSERLPRGESPRERKMRETKANLQYARQKDIQERERAAELRRMPWDFKAYNRWVGYTHILREGGWLRLSHIFAANQFVWCVRWSWKTYSFLRAIVGRRTGYVAREQRNTICRKCNALTMIKGRPYCGECDCPKGKWYWPFSILWFRGRGLLRGKNNLRRWNCPLGVHEGSYRTKRGCTTCGGK